MKLRKQAPAKALILALTAGLLGAFYAVIRSDPRIEATGQEAPGVDYERFFAPTAPSPPIADPPPITPRGRTRAS
ncbi:MAG TPA: hypothetical protein VNN10_09865 [Dehalococcoidia bacterium]|nr:hypothetical protein [Dehalococcoidia bacterium]